MDRIILNRQQLDQKVHRMAYQLYEQHQDETELVIVGLQGNGYVLAKEIHAYFQQICPIKARLLELKIDKENPFNQQISCAGDDTIAGLSMALVDDVLNSGATLIASVQYFISKPMKRITTLVLIDRNHRRFPVAADITGMSMATTVQEHVAVRSENDMLKEVVLQ